MHMLNTLEVCQNKVYKTQKKSGKVCKTSKMCKTCKTSKNV